VAEIARHAVAGAAAGSPLTETRHPRGGAFTCAVAFSPTLFNSHQRFFTARVAVTAYLRESWFGKEMACTHSKAGEKQIQADGSPGAAGGVLDCEGSWRRDLDEVGGGAHDHGPGADHGAPVSFSVSGEQVTSFALAFNFSSACSGSVTSPGPAPIRMQVPPGPPPFDQPGFAMGWPQAPSEWGIALYGAFSRDRLSVSGSSRWSDIPAATS
jgi:hypothetical protein